MTTEEDALLGAARADRIAEPPVQVIEPKTCTTGPVGSRTVVQDQCPRVESGEHLVARPTFRCINCGALTGGFPDAKIPHRNHLAVALGGPYGGRRVGLSGAPELVDIGGHSYARQGDPRAGSYLGQYVYSPGVDNGE